MAKLVRHGYFRIVFAAGLAAAAGVLLVAASACGGGGGSGAPGSNTAQGLADLTKQWAKAEAKITYSISTRIDGATNTNELALFWAPPRFRMDMALEANGKRRQTTFITNADSSYICSQESGGHCISSSGATAAGDINILKDFIDPESMEKQVSALAGGVESDGSKKEVAGQDATCFSSSRQIDGRSGSTKWCFGENGLLLLLATVDEESNTEFTIEAKEIGKVSDSDFDPPYPAIDVPAGGIPVPTR